jgi:hypothetical protein
MGPGSPLPKRRKVEVLLKKTVKTATKNNEFDGVKVQIDEDLDAERG